MTRAETKKSHRLKLAGDPLQEALKKGSDCLFSHQFPDGYWWYTLEANESINAEYIFLTHYLDIVDRDTQEKICRRIRSAQCDDGAWPLYYGGPGDLSTTIECYWALKLAGADIHDPVMQKARQFVLSHGGLSKCRVFTRIHLALFGILPWHTCPSMPVWLIEFPCGFPVSIYEFSSWARACIVPLLVVMDQKKNRHLPAGYLDELYAETDTTQIDWSFKTKKGSLTPENFFVQFDGILKRFGNFNLSFVRKHSLKKCENWIRDHIQRTEDIYPALAYGAIALAGMGYSATDPTIQKCLTALKSFQMEGGRELNCLPAKNFKTPFAEGEIAGGRGGGPPPRARRSTVGETEDRTRRYDGGFEIMVAESALYQQCCISPIWDTPWAGTALLAAGNSAKNPDLLKAGRWLISKQITAFYGDWSLKAKNVLPGGWAFEFENDYFPDVDDTIQILTFLHYLDLPAEEKDPAIRRGIAWLAGMQSSNGGFAAFDKDNTLKLVNKIPFSDHGACLDPPSPDLTGRALEYFALIGHKSDEPFIKKIISYLEKSQEENGSWYGRWAVNYLFGTGCVLMGLKAIGYDMESHQVRKAVTWLKSVQRSDGGFGESCHSYLENKYLPLPESVPSQTAWALMGLVAGGEARGDHALRAANYLVSSQKEDGRWDENHFTGTGFPGHFYIRYHGYRHYFPLLALGRYLKVIH